MSLLELLWRGGICPAECPVERDDEEYRRLINQCEADEEKLLAMLSPEEAEQLERYMDGEHALSCAAGEDAFIRGFRLGVQLLLEALQSTSFRR